MAEDLPMNQQIIAQMLESVGYEIITVADGASAVDVVRREPIDLILMDIEMPLMGGLEATSAIRALGAAGAVPIVAMTANQGPEQLAACRAAGMDAYICKPVNRQDLISTIRRWLKTSYKVAPEQRSEQRNPIDLGILDNIRVHFGSLKTHRFIEEVHTRLENVLLQLTNGTDSGQLASDLHSLVSMGGHLGLRDLSEKARALMVALREKTNNLGMAREDFRGAAIRTLMALQPEELPGHLMEAGVEDPKTKTRRVFQ
jgi:CheY-like chemotaxis protein